MSEVVRILIADDSDIFVDALSERLALESDIEIVGVACDGLVAHEMAQQLRPNVITMDIQMPQLDGFGAIERIMSSVPTPILVLTGDARSQDQTASFEALSRGALELLPKPSYAELMASEGRQLCERIRLLSGIAVIHHARPKRVVSTLAAPPTRLDSETNSIVAIAASTGGPRVLAEIFDVLPASFPLPIALVQHLAPGFVDHFTRWLSDCCELDVEEATFASHLRPGLVLVAPDERNLLVHSNGGVQLTREDRQASYCPSADLLFRSAAKHFGERSVGVVLTGMGEDGARGIADLHEAGATTIAQSGSTCAVDGMPGAARATGKVGHVLSPQETGLMLIRLACALSHSTGSAGAP